MLGLVPARGSPAPSVVAITTIDRTVPRGHERDRRILAAFRTSDGMHLARASIVPAAEAGTLAAPCLSARCAALRLVCVALLGMVRLVVGGESERL